MVNPINKTLISNQLIDFFREKIIFGSFKPGYRIVERKIASDFNISQSPVREALKIIEEEGLLVSIKNKGSYVSDISLDEMKSICEIRKTIEAVSLETIIDQINFDDFDYLNSVLDRIKIASSEKNIIDLTREDIKFHSYIIGKTNSRIIIHLWNLVQIQISRILLLAREVFQDYELIVALHQSLLDVLKTKDIKIIKKEFSLHVDSVLNEIKKINPHSLIY